MDLLCTYDVDDETSNNNNEQSTSGRPDMTSENFQSEWESFEKSIEESGQSQPVIAPAIESSQLPLPSQQEMHKSRNSDDSHVDGRAEIDQSHMAKKNSAAEKEDEQEEEDESHLPPGVRKKNRCHNSSSSSSEDEGAKKEMKDNSDSDESDTDDSGTSPNHSKVTATKEEKKEEKPKPKEAKEERTSKKARRSRSSSGSKSRSRSRSPHRKRRRSSDRSRHSRSRSRGRHHRKERKHGSSRRSRSRDRRRSKDRDHRHRHREQRRSRSRERRNSQRERRSSHDRGHRSNRDKRDRSPSPRGAKVIKYGDKVIKAGASFGRPPPSKPMTFKEKMRQQLIKAMEEGGDVSQALTSKDGTVICTQTAGTQQIPAPKKPPVPLMSSIVTSTAGLAAATITASQAAMQSMLALQKEATEKTGVEIPKYYNPAAINPMKYAEQVQKRKLLWSKTKEKDVNSQWHATSLSSDHDDKSKEKFRKLMGIKQEGTSGTVDDEDKVTEEQELKQRELFDKLDKEYQFARMATHTHRGIGLGFGSSSSYPPPST